MKPPETMEEILRKELHALESDRCWPQGIRSRDEKRYRYTLLFNESQSPDHIEKRLNFIEDKESIELSLSSFRPVIRQTDSSVEAAIEIWIMEQDDRYQLENHGIGDFVDES